MLSACITVPILYSKSRRDSRTTMPSTSTTTTKTEHLSSNKVDETTLSYGTFVTSKYSTAAVTTTPAPTTTTTSTPIPTTSPTTTPKTTPTTTTTPSTTTTTYNTKNPCFEHQCETGEICFEIDDKATCVSGTIGFLTYDKLVIFVNNISCLNTTLR